MQVPNFSQWLRPTIIALSAVCLLALWKAVELLAAATSYLF